MGWVGWKLWLVWFCSTDVEGLNTSNGLFDSPKLILLKFPYPLIFLNVFPIGIYACIPLNKFYQSNYARYLQNQYQPIEHMKIQPTVQLAHTQNWSIEYDHALPLTYIQPTAQRQIEHMQTNVPSYQLHKDQ